MADIELVVKIPEDIYKDIIKNGFMYDEDNEAITHAIKNGTPYESVTEFVDRCKECGREKVLDKIRAEIEEYRDNMQWENKSLVKWEAINYILEQIIDTYTAESEE